MDKSPTSASMCGQQEDSGDEHDQVDTNDKEYYDRLMVGFVFYYHEPWTYFVLIKIQYDISGVLCKFESRRTRYYRHSIKSRHINYYRHYMNYHIYCGSRAINSTVVFKRQICCYIQISQVYKTSQTNVVLTSSCQEKSKV